MKKKMIPLIFTLVFLGLCLIPGAGLRQETYGEFVERRREQGRVKGYGFLLHVGLVFLCAAGVFLYLYFKTA